MALLHRLALLNFKLFAAGFALLSVAWVLLAAITIILFMITTVKLDLATALANDGMGTLLAIIILMLLVGLLLWAKQVPPIHNISTDPESPPEFEKAQAMIAMRGSIQELQKLMEY